MKNCLTPSPKQKNTTKRFFIVFFLLTKECGTSLLFNNSIIQFTQCQPFCLYSETISNIEDTSSMIKEGMHYFARQMISHYTFKSPLLPPRSVRCSTKIDTPRITQQLRIVFKPITYTDTITGYAKGGCGHGGFLFTHPAQSLARLFSRPARENIFYLL